MDKMKQALAILFLFFSVGLISTARAQCGSSNPYNLCVDSSSRKDNFPCPDVSFRPVCGCDGKTYRNLCEAQCRYGMVGTYTDQPCSGFEIDILPNLLGSTTPMKLWLVQLTETPSTLVICDMYGKIYLLRNLPGNFKLELDITESLYLPQGAYILFVYNQAGVYRYKRFVKVSV